MNLSDRLPPPPSAATTIDVHAGRWYAPLMRETAVCFHLMAKPAGPRCNLRCTYCFYLEKERFFPEKTSFRMTDEVLEACTRQYIQANDAPEVIFSWQGGEPTLMGLDFYRKAVSFQKKYAAGKNIGNTLQTNGVLLDDEWGRFLAREKFLVGLSLDGPEEIHDPCRRGPHGAPTFALAMRALDVLKKRKVEFNILACINRKSAQKPQEVYRFFRRQGVTFVQFIPVVERMADHDGAALAGPDAAENAAPTPWSVDPDGYGDFLCGVFDEWVRQDVGRIFVMNFEWTLAAWAGAPQTACTFAARCGRALIVEHNGDVYSCDHFMYPEYRLGNVLTDDLRAMVESEKQRAFGAGKETSLPAACKNCDMLFACRGGCLKHRFGSSAAGEPGLNYLCAGTKKFLRHTAGPMKAMVGLLRNRRPVSTIMNMTEAANVQQIR
jgi:uncharacterized protein